MNKLSRSVYICIALIIMFTSVIHHGSMEEVRIITWDVYGYYLYLPALLKYGDVSQYAFALEHLQEYQVSGDLYQLMDYQGVKAPIYTMGMAIVYLPFYLIADGIAYLLPGIEADGLSVPYQWSVIVASWSYMMLGLIFLRKLLVRLGLSDWVIVWTGIILFLGTNYFHYATYENGMPHTYLMTLYILLMYVTVRWHQEAKWKYIISGALIIGMMCLIRPSELIAVLIPLLYGMYSGLSNLVKWHRLKKYGRQLIALCVVGFLVVLPQILFWKVSLGEWIFNGYQGHHFDWTSPHIMDGLFSFRKGWLLYTPLAMLGLIGIPLLWKKDKRWFWPILVFTLVNIYIVLSWHIWWYASSFGHRALIQSMGVLCVPLAYAIDLIYRQSIWLKYVILSLITFFIVLNQFQDWQYRNRILLQDEMNAAYYRKVFLETKQNKEWRTLIDLPGDAPDDFSPEKEILSYSSDHIDTILPDAYSAAVRQKLTSFNLAAGDWIAVTANVKCDSDRFGKWNQARMVTALKDKDDTKAWSGVRFQYLLTPDSFSSIHYSWQIPEGSMPDNQLEFYIWNAGPDTLYLQELSILTEE